MKLIALKIALLGGAAIVAGLMMPFASTEEQLGLQKTILDYIQAFPFLSLF